MAVSSREVAVGLAVRGAEATQGWPVRRWSHRYIPRIAVRRVLPVLLAVLVVAGACSNDDGPEGTTQGNVFSSTDVGVGTCLEVGEGLGAEVNSLPTIECGLEHSHEIFATPVYTEEDVRPGEEVYPGLGELEAFAQRECIPAFEDYVGIAVFDSVYFITWLLPTLDSWEDSDIVDRTALCVAGRFDAAPITGSIENQGAAAATPS